MSTAVEVREEAGTGDLAVQSAPLPTQFIPAPTLPAIPGNVPPWELGGGGVMGIPNAFSGSRAESAQNKKPFPLIKLGHLLCGFVR